MAVTEAEGYRVVPLRERPGFVEAVVSRGNQSVPLHWAQDSAYRFFPLVEHPDFGLTLHPFVDLLPADEVGKCVIDANNRLISEPPDRLRVALAEGRVRYHAGRLGGALPVIAERVVSQTRLGLQMSIF
jgi:hypothetical protein